MRSCPDTDIDQVRTENLCYFQFVNNKTITLFKMNGIPADVFL